MNTHIVKRAVVNAAGVAAYVGLFGLFVMNVPRIFGEQEGSWLGFMLGLMLFIISACVTGSLVLLAPILAYLDGRKKEAVQLFFATVAALAVMATAVVLILAAR